MATKWQGFMDDLKATLKQINGVAPYYVNINNRVYEWRAEPLVPKEIPCLVVMDGGLNLDHFTFGNSQITFTTLIYVYAHSIAVTRDLCQDVLTAIKSYFTSGTAKVWDVELEKLEIGLSKHELVNLEAEMAFTFRSITEPWKL